MRKKSTALQRCDREIRKARQHLKELKDRQSLYELEVLETEDLRTKLQNCKNEIESTEDYIKRMREWRRNSLSKLERWAREKEEKLQQEDGQTGDDVVHGKQNGEQGKSR